MPSTVLFCPQENELQEYRNIRLGRIQSNGESKYPKATACLQKDREELLTFSQFPAQHWPSLRTRNPIESAFGTIWHRRARTKGYLTRGGLLHMMYNLGQCAEKTWRRLRGFQQLPKVIKGIQFTDGIEETTIDPVAA